MREEFGGHEVHDAQPLSAADGRGGHLALATHGADAPATDLSESGGQSASDTRMQPAAGDGLGHCSDDRHLTLAQTIDLLNGLQRQRRFCIRMQNRIGNAAGAYVRTVLGWSPALPEKEREAIRKRAAAVVKAIEKGQADGVDPDIAVTVALALKSREPFDERRKLVEKAMRQAARQLPVWPWVEGIRGFGDLSLAVIVAEAGDLSGYANPGKLWKRLGLAPKQTYRQADNGAHMVPKARRAEIFACVGDPLLKGNDGEYRAEYDRMKAAYLERGWTKLHAHRAAQRYMEKRLIRNLWQAWRAAILGLIPIGKLPPADQFVPDLCA